MRAAITPQRLVPVLLAAAAVILLAVVLGREDHDGFRLRAEIADAEGISKNFVVRVNGIDAGRVTGVHTTRRDTAMIDLELEPGAGVPGRGARLSARAANLLGEKYLDLSPGDTRRPMPEGGVIPLAATRSEVQLDDIFNTLDTSTRAKLRILVNEAGLGLSGRGTDLNATLQQLPGTLLQTTTVLAQLRRENAELGRLITRGDQVLTTIDRRRAEPVRFVRSTAHLLETVAARRAGLADTVRQAPATLRQTRRSLDLIARTATRLTPAAGLLRQAAPALDRTLVDLPATAAATSRTLDTATRVAPTLQRLGTRGTGDVRRLSRTLATVGTFSTALRPLSESLGRGGVVAGILDVLHNWDRTINRGDGLGRFFRLRLVVTPAALNSLIDRLAPAVTAKGGTRRPSGAGPVAKTVKDATGAVQKAAGEVARKVTGPSKDSAPNAVSQLLKTLTGGGAAAAPAPRPTPAPAPNILDRILHP